MSLLLSLSNPVCKLIKQDLPRIYDDKGKNPGVQPIKTHSTQIAWQCQVIDLSDRYWRSSLDYDGWLIIFVEAHSRYTLMRLYPLKPDWPQIEDDFLQQWLNHMLHWMSISGFVSGQQADSVVKQFEGFLGQNPPELVRNLDMSINGNLADYQQWLRDYLGHERPRYLGDDEIAELCSHLNHLTKTQNKQRCKKKLIYPIDRFLDDALFRFAKGLSDQPVDGCRMGDFPNPYRAAVTPPEK